MLSGSIAHFDVGPLAKLFKALGDPTRLRIVALLSQGELCVCHLETALELSQPTASRHLSVLRAAGVVETRREGTWVYYSLASKLDDACKAQLKALADAFGKRDVLRRDLDRLLKSQGPNACR
jgi:ArsR family transcriptional regulator